MSGDSQYGPQDQSWTNPGQGPQDAVPGPQPGQFGQPGPVPQQWQQQAPYQQPYQQPYRQGGYPPQPPRKSNAAAVIIAAVGVVVVLGIVAAIVLVGTSSHGAPAAVASAQPVATSAAASTDDAATGGNPLAYEASGTSAVAGIGVPTFDSAAAHKDYTVTFRTNRGNIVVDMNGNAAPYTVFSFVYLADKNYFNNTKCHRLTTSGIYVLQCGDPTGTGTGGPGYTIPDENLASLGTPDASGTVTYKAGLIAMANTGQAHTGGSQFFILYKDSPLSPTYTPFGTVTQGLSIIQQVAAAGTDNSNGSGDGAPNDPVQIETVTVQ